MIANQEMAEQILDMMDTALEASSAASAFIADGKLENARLLLKDMYQLLQTINRISQNLKVEEPHMNLPEASSSCAASLQRIFEYTSALPNQALKKIEFELDPLIIDMRCSFYFWAIIYPHEERMQNYFKNEIPTLYRNKYIEASEKSGFYKYDLSISVRAFNHLEYTKSCVESLIRNLPRDLKYELILINHGSSDGTKEYFESIKPDKQFDIEVNGGGFGATYRIVEGKYYIQISNDIIITKNAIENMYHCISSDTSIGWAVPATSNVSNLQSLPAKYKSKEEMELFAASNNIPDKSKWEQRVRLVNPVDIFNMKGFFDTGFYGYNYDTSNLFPDDRLSLLFRRRGKKFVLVKDAYCHHYGSVTHKGTDSSMRETYQRGRVAFENIFGIDPWGKGFCYDSILFNGSINLIRGIGHKKILGINCGLGSNPLKIKTLFKELLGNSDVFLHNITNEYNYLEDLKGVSDTSEMFEDFNSLTLPIDYYDYIVVEGGISSNGNYRIIIQKLISALAENGILLISLREQAIIKWFSKKYKNCVQQPNSNAAGEVWFIYVNEPDAKAHYV